VRRARGLEGLEELLVVLLSSLDGLPIARHTFVLSNHVTTPFFMRMGLVDDNISDPFVGRSTPDTFSATIAAPDEGPVAMFDAWSAWRSGAAAIVVSGPGGTTVCP